MSALHMVSKQFLHLRSVETYTTVGIRRGEPGLRPNEYWAVRDWQTETILAVAASA